MSALSSEQKSTALRSCKPVCQALRSLGAVQHRKLLSAWRAWQTSHIAVSLLGVRLTRWWASADLVSPCTLHRATAQGQGFQAGRIFAQQRDMPCVCAPTCCRRNCTGPPRP